MNGELGQLVALVSYGNAIVSGRLETTALDEHATFDATSRVNFRYPSGTRSVSEWFGHLRIQGVDRLELDAIHQLASESVVEALPRNQRASFKADGVPKILAQTRRHTEVWQAEWTIVPLRQRTDDDVWTVEYRLIFSGPRLQLIHPAVSESTRALARSLQRLEQFASVHCSNWVPLFQAASKALVKPISALSIDDSLLPTTPPDAARLYEAAAAGWIFGGMGSWTDLDFDDHETNDAYIRATTDHYEATLRAIDAAANVRDAR